MDIDEIRRANLKNLETEFGAPFVANEAGMSLSQFYNLRDGAKDSKTGKPRGMRKDTARRFETACEKPIGWLDINHHDSPEINKPTHIANQEISPYELSIDDAITLLELYRQADKSDREGIMEMARAAARKSGESGNTNSNTIQARNKL